MALDQPLQNMSPKPLKGFLTFDMHEAQSMNRVVIICYSFITIARLR